MTHNIKFDNRTTQPLVLGFYLQSGTGDTIFAVIWKMLEVPPGGSGAFTYDDQWGVLLGEASIIGGNTLFTPASSLPADLGSSWKIIEQAGVPVIAQSGTGAPDNTILIHSDIDSPPPAGLSLSGSPFVYVQLVRNMTASFALPPQTFAALFAPGIVPGEVVNPQLILVGPVGLSWPDGVTHILFTAEMQGSQITLMVTTQWAND